MYQCNYFALLYREVLLKIVLNVVVVERLANESLVQSLVNIDEEVLKAFVTCYIHFELSCALIG